MVGRRRVHDAVAHSDELLLGKRLSEEIGDVVDSRHERHTDAVLLNEFTHVEMAPINVFHTSVMFRIVSHINARAVIHV